MSSCLTVPLVVACSCDYFHFWSQLQLSPFAVILGSALQFERWTQRLWTVLRLLTDSSPSTIIALAHSVNSLPSPPEDFHEERVSGIRYGMHTEWTMDESDFEVQVLSRVFPPTDLTDSHPSKVEL